MSRDPNAKVTLTLRMQERLRSRLEEAAKGSDNSLNNEITKRIEQSFFVNDLVPGVVDRTFNRVFSSLVSSMGGEGNFPLAVQIGISLSSFEYQIGKNWRESDEARTEIERMLIGLIPRLLNNPPPPWQARPPTQAWPNSPFQPLAQSHSADKEESISAEAGQKVEGILGSFKDASSSPTSDDEEPQS